MSERRNSENFIIEAFSEFEKLLIALNALVFLLDFSFKILHDVAKNFLTKELFKVVEIVNVSEMK